MRSVLATAASIDDRPCAFRYPRVLQEAVLDLVGAHEECARRVALVVIGERDALARRVQHLGDLIEDP